VQSGVTPRTVSTPTPTSRHALVDNAPHAPSRGRWGGGRGRRRTRVGRKTKRDKARGPHSLARQPLNPNPVSQLSSFPSPGSHTVLALLDTGHSVTIVDNLDNAFMECYDRMKELAGPEKAAKMSFIKADLRDAAAIDAALGSAKFDAVIHFAGRKAVGESVAEPMLYYTHNVAGTVNLIEAMRKHGVKRMVFSSSCTVYGEPAYTPLDEKHPRSAMSPYGRTKLMIEDIFNDVAPSEDGWRVILLRYFNPVGAHPSGRIGEHPVGIPNNLMPFVQQVALGIRPQLNVFGTDYPTRDGTCIRDYIHVSDLAVSLRNGGEMKKKMERARVYEQTKTSPLSPFFLGRPRRRPPPPGYPGRPGVRRVQPGHGDRDERPRNGGRL